MNWNRVPGQLRVASYVATSRGRPVKGSSTSTRSPSTSGTPSAVVSPAAGRPVYFSAVRTKKTVVGGAAGTSTVAFKGVATQTAPVC